MIEYEDKTFPQAYYPGIGKAEGINYCLVALSGEVGETLNKWKKALRDDGISLANQRIGWSVIHPGRLQSMIEEAGDCLWYLTALARELGVSLQELANMNYEKIKKRQAKYNQLG